MRLLLILSAAATLLACDRAGTTPVDLRRPRPAVAGGAWVARFGGEGFSAGELNQRFQEMNPYARARYQTVEQRREYVEGLVRYELLAQEAVRRGLANDPEVVESARRVMVQLLLKRDVEEASAQISDAQVAAYYAQHRDDFVKPAMTRLSRIFFDEARAGDAAEVLAQVQALAPMDYAGFARLAREHDQDGKTRPLEGDLRFLSDAELAAQQGPEVVAAAATLTQVGQVFPTLVKTAKGFHILKLQGRQVALDLALDQAKPSIQQVLVNEGKQERFAALIERLKKQAGYEVNEVALAGLSVDPRAPALEPKGPVPGYLPAPVGPLLK